MVHYDSLAERVRSASRAVYFIGAGIHGCKLFLGRDSISPLTEHIGNFALVAIPILYSKGQSGAVERAGHRCNSRLLESAGRYFPEIATSLTLAYFALGESLLPQILPGKADPKDIPAVIIAGLSAYLSLGRRN